MKVKELIELLEQFDGEKCVCISDSSRYGCSYAYDVQSARDASMERYYCDEEEEEVVRILLGEQIGTVE